MNFELEKQLTIDEIKETKLRLDISGYVAIFGVPDDAGDVIIFGAFSNWLKKNFMPPIWYRHTYKIGQTESLAEDAKGLRFDGFINKETPEGLYVVDMIKLHGVRGMSFRFSATGYMGSDSRRYMAEILEVLEISVTPFPTQKLAIIESFKSNKDFYKHWKELAIKNLMLTGITKREANEILRYGTACVIEEIKHLNLTNMIFNDFQRMGEQSPGE